MQLSALFSPTCIPTCAAAAPGGVSLDPDEPEAIQKLRKDIHAIRVSLIRSAQRLGYDHENGLVKQVLYRCACMGRDMCCSGVSRGGVGWAA